MDEIIQGDCLEVMRTFPDKSFDLVLTDPPYGIGADKGVGGFGQSATDKHYDDIWDSVSPARAVFEEILRVSKNAIIFGGNFFTDKLPQRAHWICWDKKGGIKFANPFGHCELAWTDFDRSSVKKYTIIQQGFVSEERQRFHPTQKPVGLFAAILKDYADAEMRVLDRSWEVAQRCLQLACLECATGIEISEKYCEIARKRLAQEMLF
jgi:site-specific DNA-methyltransferase (adenine-specific)